MNPELKAKWIEALRSGEYTQGRGKLRVDNPDGTSSFCCLGVLCMVAGIKISTGGHDATPRDAPPVGAILDGYQPIYDVLDIKRVGDSTPISLVNDRTVLNQLIRMNDSEQSSFDEIADFVERKL